MQFNAIDRSLIISQVCTKARQKREKRRRSMREFEDFRGDWIWMTLPMDDQASMRHCPGLVVGDHEGDSRDIGAVPPRN